jgi:hypothetical protein
MAESQPPPEITFDHSKIPCYRPAERVAPTELTVRTRELYAAGSGLAVQVEWEAHGPSGRKFHAERDEQATAAEQAELSALHLEQDGTDERAAVVRWEEVLAAFDAETPGLESEAKRLSEFVDTQALVGDLALKDREKLDKVRSQLKHREDGRRLISEKLTDARAAYDACRKRLATERLHRANAGHAGQRAEALNRLAETMKPVLLELAVLDDTHRRLGLSLGRAAR